MDNNGTQGLGVLNSNRDNSCMETPNGFLEKRDTDSRKLVTDGNKFISTDKFAEYLKNWLVSTNMFTVGEVEDTIKAQLNFSSIFYTMWVTNNGNTSCNNRLCIISCLNLDNVQNIISLIGSSNNSILTASAVIMYYGSVNDSIKSEAKRLGIELLGSEEIYEINNAIDSADKGMPYMCVNNVRFATYLASSLNQMYRNSRTGGNWSNSIANEATALGSSFGASLKEGLEQLKNSIGSLFASFKSQPNQNMNQQNYGQQTYVQPNPMNAMIRNETNVPMQPTNMMQPTPMVQPVQESVLPEPSEILEDTKEVTQAETVQTPVSLAKSTEAKEDAIPAGLEDDIAAEQKAEQAEQAALTEETPFAEQQALCEQEALSVTEAVCVVDITKEQAEASGNIEKVEVVQPVEVQQSTKKSKKVKLEK